MQNKYQEKLYETKNTTIEVLTNSDMIFLSNEWIVVQSIVKD